MKIVKDDCYEEIAATYQCLEIETLNKVLKKNGIEKELRQKICEEFSFSFGNFIDQYWFEGDNKKVFPRICFLEESEESTLYFPSDFFAFHEYSSGNNYWYFEEHNEDASEIRRGVIDKESE